MAAKTCQSHLGRRIARKQHQKLQRVLPLKRRHDNETIIHKEKKKSGEILMSREPGHHSQSQDDLRQPKHFSWLKWIS